VPAAAAAFVAAAGFEDIAQESLGGVIAHTPPRQTPRTRQPGRGSSPQLHSVSPNVVPLSVQVLFFAGGALPQYAFIGPPVVTFVLAPPNLAPPVSGRAA
jgi:hypothetical protein